MEKEFNVSLLETGIAVQFGEEKFLMSFEETNLPWEKAKEWVMEKDGDLPTIDQLLIVHEHLDEINTKLTEAGKKTISGWYWTSREYLPEPNCAWAVSMGSGYVVWSGKHNLDRVRAVSAFPTDLK